MKKVKENGDERHRTSQDEADAVKSSTNKASTKELPTIHGKVVELMRVQ